jgi:hypothetical protein
VVAAPHIVGPKVVQKGRLLPGRPIAAQRRGIGRQMALTKHLQVGMHRDRGSAKSLKAAKARRSRGILHSVARTVHKGNGKTDAKPTQVAAAGATEWDTLVAKAEAERAAIIKADAEWRQSQRRKDAETMVNEERYLSGVFFIPSDLSPQLQDKLKQVLRAVHKSDAEMLVHPIDAAKALTIAPPTERSWAAKARALGSRLGRLLGGKVGLYLGLSGVAQQAAAGWVASLGTWLGPVSVSFATALLGTFLTGALVLGSLAVIIPTLVQFFNGELMEDLAPVDADGTPVTAGKPMCQSVYERCLALLDAHDQQLALLGVRYQKQNGPTVGHFAVLDDEELAQLRPLGITRTPAEAEENRRVLQRLLQAGKGIQPVFKHVTIVADTDDCRQMLQEADKVTTKGGGRHARQTLTSRGAHASPHTCVSRTHS